MQSGYDSLCPLNVEPRVSVRQRTPLELAPVYAVVRCCRLSDVLQDDDRRAPVQQCLARVHTLARRVHLNEAFPPRLLFYHNGLVTLNFP